MAKSSKGARARTRSVFRVSPKKRGLSPITRSFQRFENGERATIIIDPRIHKGQPHARYHGLTGTIKGTQGRAYLLSVRTGGKHKELVVLPEHLKRFTG